MFNGASDQLMPATPKLGRAAIAVGLMAVIVLVLLVSRGAGRGRLDDLCPQDAKVVEEIQQAGVTVSEREWPTSFHPCMTVRIRWNPELRQYCVDSLALWSVNRRKIDPLLNEFVALRDVRVH